MSIRRKRAIDGLDGVSKRAMAVPKIRLALNSLFDLNACAHEIFPPGSGRAIEREPRLDTGLFVVTPGASGASLIEWQPHGSDVVCEVYRVEMQPTRVVMGASQNGYENALRHMRMRLFDERRMPLVDIDVEFTDQ